MSTTQTVVLEIQETDKKRNSFFNHQKKVRSGAPEPNLPDGSKTIFDDDHDDSNRKHRDRGCCVLS